CAGAAGLVDRGAGEKGAMDSVLGESPSRVAFSSPLPTFGLASSALSQSDLAGESPSRYDGAILRRAQARLRLSRFAEGDSGATGDSPASRSLAGSGLDRALNSIDAAFAEYGPEKRRGASKPANPAAGRASAVALPRRPSRRGSARHSADIVPEAAGNASPALPSPPLPPTHAKPAAVVAAQGAPPVRRVRVVKRPGATAAPAAALAAPAPAQALQPVRRVAAVASESPHPQGAPGVGQLHDAADDLREAVKSELRLTMKAFAGGVRALLGSAARAEAEAESAAEALRRANERADAAERRASQLEAELLSAEARAKEAHVEAARMAAERDEAAAATRKRELRPLAPPVDGAPTPLLFPTAPPLPRRAFAPSSPLRCATAPP
ncbi:unnamed protein product, partial [Symbiodinium sp. KB8]